MIDKAAASNGAVPSEANTTFDDLVRPKTPKQSRFFIGGRGDDKYTGTSKSDFAYGAGGDDTLKGKAGNDVLAGGQGNDKLNGGSGNDRLYGGSGNDTIRTGTGDDTVKAGSGDDKIVVKGGATVDGGAGKDTVVLKGSRNDYVQSKIAGPNQLYFDQRDGSRVELKNVETVRFSEVTPPEPPKPPEGPSQKLAPNDAGADRIIVGKDSIRILGPNTDFTFTDLTDQRPVDGPLTARSGSGIINGEQTTAVSLGFGDAVFSLGSGFNPTGTQAVKAAFANGVTLDSESCARPDRYPSQSPFRQFLSQRRCHRRAVSASVQIRSALSASSSAPAACGSLAQILISRSLEFAMAVRRMAR